MPTGKEVSGYRGHLRPAWTSWHPEALTTVGEGPPARLEEGLQTAHAGPFAGVATGRRILSPSPQSLRCGARVSEGLPAQRSRRAGQPRPRDVASPLPACLQTVGRPGCQEPSPSAPLFPGQGLPVPLTSSGAGSAPAPAIRSRGQASRSGRPPESPQGPGLCRLQGAACGPLLSGCGPGDASLSACQLPLLQIRSVSLPGHVYIKCPGRHLSAIGAQK